MGPAPIPPEERFWAKVDKTGPGECWQWTGSLKPQGYGCLRLSAKKQAKAHRFSYELLVGPVPKGLVLDHLCRNRGCVNPEHLEPVTNKTNLLRGESMSAQNARKTHCKHGHELTPENVVGNPHGWRPCRECARLAKRRYRAQDRERAGLAA